MKQTSRIALTVTSGYLALAGGWIFISEAMWEPEAGGPESWVKFSSIQIWGLIAMTAALSYLVLRQSSRGHDLAGEPPRPDGLNPKPASALVATEISRSDFVRPTEKKTAPAARERTGMVETETARWRQETLAESNPNPEVALSATGEILYGNAAGRDLAREIGSGELHEILPPNAIAIAQGCLASQQPRLRQEMATRNRILSWSFVPAPQGDVIHGYAENITDRRRAEQRLRESQDCRQALLECSTDPVFVTDFEGKFLEANNAALSLFGYRREDLGTITFGALLTSDQLALALRLMDELRTTGRQKQPAEFQLRTKDGKQVRVETRAALVYRDGKPYGIQGVARDVTVRRQSESVQALLVTAAEQAAESIIITDPKATILYANPAFEKVTGYTRAEAVGQTPRLLKSGKHDDAFYRQMWSALNRGQVWHGRFVNKRKDGKLYEEEATISPVRDSQGKIVNYVAVKRDVTSEIQLEAQFRQAQKMEAIGQLAAGVAHDFNNLLAIIQLQISLLKHSGELSAELGNLADDIGATVERGAALTRQMLLFSRREALQLIDLDLNTAMGNLGKMLMRILGETIQLQLNVSPEAMFVHADGGMMDQMVMNLVVNARDAMPNGGRLMIETGALEIAGSAPRSGERRPGSFVRLSVRDTGCGIPPEVLPRIFEPFYTTKGAGKGTGMGLATVSSIVQRHGGWIEVVSKVGSGTEFQIYLPRLVEFTAKTIPAKMPTVAPTGHETVLVVEDEAALRVALRKSLRQQGYRVLEAPSGAKAWEVWQAHRDEIHLLLTDLVMPEGLTGRALAQRILAEKPEAKVIYMSGYSVEADLDLQLQDGDNYLPKPFAMPKLARTVRQKLDQPVTTISEPRPAATVPLATEITTGP